MKVILADDHPIFRSGLKFLVESSFDHVEIQAYENGSQVIDNIPLFNPDIVLLDIDMPVMDGLTSARQIRALPCARGKVPIVALTADVMNDAVQQTMAAGMNAFLSKPLQKNQLITKS